MTAQAFAARPITHLLYLHGFRSSAASTKASRMASLMHAHHPDIQWWCPQLPPSPRDAIGLIAAGIAGWPRGRCAVVGSSLGGYYATWVGERMLGRQDRVVVLNPAVDPARDLARYIGVHSSWHDPAQRFEFTAAHVHELLALDPGPLTHRQRYFALLARGDEVLDWREMAQRYAGCPMKLLEGSDHAISDFDHHVGDVLAALGLPPAPSARD